MPARSRKNARRARTSKKPKIVVLLVLMLIYLFYPSNWDKDMKISIANPVGEIIEIVHIDPESESVTTVLIPGDTEVSVANNLGKWPLRSVWELGEKEGLSGELLQNTVTKSFGFPVSAWGGVGFSDKSSLTLKDKIKLRIFVATVPNGSKQTIDLKETQYLQEAEIVAGERGYIVRDRRPARLLALFSSQLVSEEQATIDLENGSATRKATTDVAEVAKVLGAKITTVNENIGTNNEDCMIVYSRGNITANYLSQVFGCDLEFVDQDGSADILIKIGSKFSDRF